MANNLIYFSFLFLLSANPIRAVEHCACSVWYSIEYNNTIIYNPQVILLDSGTYVDITITADFETCCYWWGEQYKWFLNTDPWNDASISTSFYQATFRISEPGTYQIVGDAVAGMFDWVFEFDVILPDSIVSIPISKIILYPNPTRNNFSLNYSLNRSASVEYTLTSLSGILMGREVNDESEGEISKHFNLSKYPAGYYFLSIKSDNLIIRRKIIKQ